MDQQIQEEKNKKTAKEMEGNKCVKEAREDLQKICKVLLQKKLEHEDLMSEKNALIQEINILKDTCDKCKDRCKNKQMAIGDDITAVVMEIQNFSLLCVRCNQCTDTVDVRKLCTDCPRCVAKRQCKIDGDTCSLDPKEECVCLQVKTKFLDNVFENMYMVLEKKIQTDCGKCVATEVVQCLRRSRNGKLNDRTKKMLQEFILTTVKKNLNLTIVGGAIKTRCEMDADTFNQLMICLKTVKVTPVPKTDTGTDSKKDPCVKWGRECHCPKGPKSCICSRKGPPGPKDPEPPEDTEDAGQKVVCPHKANTTCGPECGARTPNRVGADVAAWRPDPCAGPAGSCAFGKNMRAAQCVLGPESLTSLVQEKPTIPWALRELDGQFECQCHSGISKPCVCIKDSKQLKANYHKKCVKCFGETVYSKTEIHDDSDEIQYTPILEETDYEDFEEIEKLKADVIGFENKSATTEAELAFSDGVTEPLVKFTEFSPFSSLFDLDSHKNFDTKSTQEPTDYYVNVFKTSSGAPIMELDELLINKLLDQSKENADSFIFLTKTESGRYLLDSKSRNTTPLAKLQIRSNNLGAITLDVVPDEMNHADLQSSLSGTSKKDSTSSLPIEVVKKEKRDQLTNKKQFHKPSEKTRAAQIYPKESSADESESLSKVLVTVYEDTIYNTEKELKNLHSCHTEKRQGIEYYKSELKHYLYNRSNRLYVFVQSENGTTAKIEATVEQTPSQQIALDVSNIKHFGDFIQTECERPVLLSKSLNGIYFLFIGKRATHNCNVILRNTSSGRQLVVIKDPKLLTNEKNTLKMNRSEIFQIKLTGPSNTTKVPPAVLKHSPSKNYILVIDKEFEKQQIEQLNDEIDSLGECYVELRKTSSGIEINFDDTDVTHVNAVLVRTDSGNLKILVHGPIFEDLCSNGTSFRRSSDQIQSILHKVLNVSNVNGPNTHKGTIKHTETKRSRSDSVLYENERTKESTSILSNPSTTLKVTPSGKYTALLDKESKKVFINDLKKYLKTSSHGLIPVKKTNSGEITIVMNPDEAETSQFGSLKITPSGNVYIVLDDKSLAASKCSEKMKQQQQITEKKNLHTADKVEAGSEHLIKKVKNPVDRSTFTSCSDEDDECVCTPGKCNCDMEATVKKQPIGVILDEYGMKSDNKFPKPKHTRCSDTDCDPDKCGETCPGEMPRSRGKPCECHMSKNNKQCFFITESVHPLEQCKKSIEVPRFVRSCSEKTSLNSINRSAKSSIHAVRSYKGWNSLQYLPPQLPAFLQGPKCSHDECCPDLR